jgi:hypothetical protein
MIAAPVEPSWETPLRLTTSTSSDKLRTPASSVEKEA